MEKVLNLTAEQCAEISALAGIFDYNKDTTPGKAGKQYRRFKYDGTVFIVPTDHEFVNHYDNDELAEAKILLVPDENDATITRYQLDCCKSKRRVLKLIDFNREKQVRSKLDYKPAPTNDVLLNAIG